VVSFRPKRRLQTTNLRWVKPLGGRRAHLLCGRRLKLRTFLFDSSDIRCANNLSKLIRFCVAHNKCSSNVTHSIPIKGHFLLLLLPKESHGLLMIDVWFLFHVAPIRIWTKISAVVRCVVESCWNMMTHGDPQEGKWRGNWRIEWVASTLHTTSEHGVVSITTADAHTSAASSRLNWRPTGRFKWTRPLRRKAKSGFCACAVTFQT